MATADPSQSFADAGWQSIQCAGRITPATSISPIGILGQTPALGLYERFHRLEDFVHPGTVSYRFALDSTDEMTAGSYRCEMVLGAHVTTALPRGEVFWHAFSFRIPASNTAQDEYLVMQWHPGDGTGLLPILSVNLRGDVMRLIARSDLSGTPHRSTTQTTEVWSSATWPRGAWIDVVIRGELSVPSDGVVGSLDVWLNGTKIVQRVGPLGFGLTAARPYAKHGLYHWVDHTNPWDVTSPTRELYLRRAVVVRDKVGRYTFDDLSEAIAPISIEPQ